MKRAVLCVQNPQDYIDQLDDYSIMIINPAAPEARKQYLLDQADWTLKITQDSEQWRTGGDYDNERVFWYTSGTTGDSKFYSFSQAQLDRMATTICQAYDITANDRYVGIMPLWHAHGQGFYWATRRAGCETHFLPTRQIKRMTQYQPTFVTAIPDILVTMCQLSFDHLRFVRGASAPMPDALYQRLQYQFSVPVIEAFGMTEALSHCFTNPLHGEQRMGTVGLPDGIQAEIRNGELWIRGPCLFTPDWFNTGDLAEQDSAGYFRILGRSVDQINIRGYKFNPVAIEQHLKNLLPDLIDVVVFGSQSLNCMYVGELGTKQVQQALVQIHPGCWPTLLQQCDTIPVGPGGKLSRTWLTQTFA